MKRTGKEHANVEGSCLDSISIQEHLKWRQSTTGGGNIWFTVFHTCILDVCFCIQNCTCSSSAQTKRFCKKLTTNFVVSGEIVDSESQYNFRRVDNAFVYNTDLTVRGQPIQYGQRPLKGNINKVWWLQSFLSSGPKKRRNEIAHLKSFCSVAETFFAAFLW